MKDIEGGAVGAEGPNRWTQRDPTDGRLHPCIFLSRKLSSAKYNYGICNCELLAVKLALEEWRHWLEATEQPFLVWTDHKNLE